MFEEQNKAVIQKYFGLLTDGNIDGAFDLISEDVEWVVPESLSTTPLKWSRVKERAKEMHVSAKGTFRQWVVAMTAEGDRVATQAQSYAILPNGKEYKNKYHYLFIVQNGKIVKITAYHDSAHAREILML